MKGNQSRSAKHSAEPKKVEGFTWMELLIVAISFFAIFWFAYGFTHWLDGSFVHG